MARYADLRRWSIELSPAERALRERFDATYAAGQSPVMRAVERSVCGCDYGATSWTTVNEAQRIGDVLALAPGLRLLEIGGGSGWPALYLAKTSGCDVFLIDLPIGGLRIAAQRAIADDLTGAFWVAVADGGNLPFSASAFDAVSHSDVLCCLPRKRAVLTECRRVIRSGGRMVFSVISVASNLAPAAYVRAVTNGPEFVEAEADYPTLLGETGWTMLERHDLTQPYAASCRRQLSADAAHRDALTSLLSAAAFAERQASWQAKLACLEEGLLRRELFVSGA
jgi:ubiquinone/menaquinone biosynthesis C-methylase UbiE